MKNLKKNENALRVYIDEGSVIIEKGTILSIGKKEIKFKGEYFTSNFRVDQWGHQFFSLKDIEGAKQLEKRYINKEEEN